jgi:hypothetical protein
LEALFWSEVVTKYQNIQLIMMYIHICTCMYRS